MVETAMEEDRRCSWPMKALKTPYLRSLAIETAQSVMNQLASEIPQFNLDQRFLTIQDGSHRSTMSWRTFIIMRHAEAFEELLKEEP